MLYKVKTNLKNIPGWRTKRKIIVFDSDDWGGIRTPSLEVYEKLKESGVDISENQYKYDSLASGEDLEHLFHVLEAVEDSKGRHAVFTPVSNVANPDFDRIKENDFQRYYYEKFTDTLARYYKGEGTFEVWKRGMDAGIFVPELHGREHVAVQLWLQKLREGHRELHLAFDQGVVAVRIAGLNPHINDFRPAYYFNSPAQKPFLKESVLDGVSLFKDIFGYTPATFVPSNGIFHPEFEEALAQAEVAFLNVDRFASFPTDQGELKSKYHRTGSTNRFGTTYYLRNCSFEPSSEDYNGIEATLYQIAVAFAWRKPAFISTHRVNYMGSIEGSNRSRGLTELGTLLDEIVKRWPEVEFMSAGEALRSLRDSNNS